MLFYFIQTFIDIFVTQILEVFVMKVFNFIYVCVIVFLISFAANAQCPPGWTPQTIVFGPDPSLCSWEVEFCTKCDVTGASPSVIRVLNIKPIPLGGGCLAPDKDWLVNQLINYYYTSCTPKPCSEGCTTYLVEIPSCWQCTTLGNFYQGNYIYTSWYAPCPGSGYCQITTKVCKSSIPPYLIEKCSGWTDTYEEFDVNCPIMEPHPECPTEFEEDFEGERPTGLCIKLYNCYYE